jgi:Glyoxalase-like domain
MYRPGALMRRGSAPRGYAPPPVELDHVLIAVTDLDAAARELEGTHGLASIRGGRHRGWGTANRIVPLGDTYLELVAVVDRGEAAASAFGRWVAGAATDAGRPFAWAVRPDDLDAVAQRLALEVHTHSRDSPDGSQLSWRLAGLEAATAEPPLPFFVQWTGGTFPGRSADPQPASIARLSLRGDPARLSAWLGEHQLPIATEPDTEPGVAELTLEDHGHSIILGG